MDPVGAAATSPDSATSEEEEDITGEIAPTEPSASRFAIFVPTTDPIRHRIDYEIYDFALKNIVISMGPSIRERPAIQASALGTRVRQGHNSRYLLEGSLVGFSFLDQAAIDSFGEYRRDLQSVGDTLDISTLPRNEQLAYWFNLHNVAMLEQISRVWPVRQPREIEIDGMPLDDAPFITVRGVQMSLRDIRENIVYANWRDPKVIYGFWRGEIGGPALEREAFTGANVSSLLDLAATDFVNSLRGTERRGGRLDVSTLYLETAPFFFVDFDADLRAHLANYANEETTSFLDRTEETRATISEYDIADLAGGSRGANYLTVSSFGGEGQTPTGRVGIPPGVVLALQQRTRKLAIMRRRGMRTGYVIFSEIELPGTEINDNAVE